jgi:hypothetical protein
MRKLVQVRFVPLLACLCLLITAAQAQITLTGISYTQDFNTIGSGLPAGFSLVTGAGATSPGASAAFTTTHTNWNSTTGRFANYASANIGASATTARQAAAGDRALGIRQTGSFGDPGAAIVLQIANTMGFTGLVLDFNLQSLDVASARTTTWRVDYGLGTRPVSFIEATTTGNLSTGGASFSNQPIHADFGNALDNQPGVVTIRIVAIGASAGSGNRATTAIDDLKLSYTPGGGTSNPALMVQPALLSFPPTATGGNATAGYTLTGGNLTNDVVISAGTPWSVSADSLQFNGLLTIPAADPHLATGKTIYVRFAPATAGTFTGTITHASTGAAPQTVTVWGEGTDARHLMFQFNTCTPSGLPGSGWLSINTSGAQQWACSQFGYNGSNGVSVNGFSGGAAQTNEAWLISPALNVSNMEHMPVLSFYSRGEFNGPLLQVLVSTDYNGSGSPATATWTEISNAHFPTPPGSATTEWTFSDNIDLSAYKSAAKFYIAFRYTSSPALHAARWTIDEVAINDQATLLSVSPLQLNFGEVPAGSHSAGMPLAVRAVGNTDITLTAPEGYQLSRDSLTYSTSLVIDQATAAAGTMVYVRFSPTVKALQFGGFIHISGTDLNKNAVALSGSSYPKAETFDVACFNLAFFGSNDNNNASPAKITAQINNIATVLQRLHADVVAVEEVSGDSAMDVLLTKLPHHAAILSHRWSYSFEAPDPGFPPQKIGFIYDTTTMKISAGEPPRVLFESMYDSARLQLPGHRIVHYPTGRPGSFWSSGRLPFMATFNARVNGQTRKIRLIVLHAKSSSDAESYQRRVYDVQVLKDSIDAFYRNDQVIILGDYNDRLFGSIFRGGVSPYQAFVIDSAAYTPLTYALDSLGR